MAGLQKRSDANAVRITTAAGDPREDQRRRQRNYLASMSLRTVCFVGALVVTGPFRWVLVAGAIFLPYVAVVLANAVTRREDDFVLSPFSPDTPELTAGPSHEGGSATR
ncbi:hypothetical protein GCM10009737_09110 [Nocardioides lentus]|uniref:DUF3099 domain-containing protein n=1 Tax=Nocardioides lentus TaxID=338077 RepID=A0ABN2P2J5_9ACTN